MVDEKETDDQAEEMEDDDKGLEEGHRCEVCVCVYSGGRAKRGGGGSLVVTNREEG